MIIQEHKLRQICRSNESMDCLRFQEALDKSKDDPVPVSFEVDFNVYKTFNIPRKECEYYAQIVQEELKAEDELLEYVNPQLHLWARNNRAKVCSTLQDAKEKHNPRQQSNVVLIWPLCPPDSVPLELVDNYLRRYS